MKHIWIGLVALAVAGQGVAGTLRLKSGTVNTSSAAVKTMSVAQSSATQQETLTGKICQLVQFGESPSDEDQKQLQAVGGEIVGYVPDNAMIVFINSSDSDLLDGVPGVEWTGPCLPEYKLSSDLDLTQSEVEVVISLFKPGFLQRVEWWIEQQQGTVENSGRGASRASIRATLSPDSIEELASLAEVEWIEPFVQMELHNNVAVEAPRMNVKTVWETRGLTGEGQVVAVGDSGLDVGGTGTMHPDFLGRIRYANSFLYGDDWKDYNGHGTHVSGSVLGSGAAYSNGMYRGVAYEAELVMQALGDNSGSSSIYYPSSLGTLFEEAYTNGARIHQDSWGSTAAGAYTSASRDVDDFMWQHDDMLVVFSAGNSGVDANNDGVIDLQSLGSPGTAKNCLTVGAAESARPAGSGGYSSYVYGSGSWAEKYPTEPVSGDLMSTSDDGVNQGMAAFSSRGPCADGRIKPDVVAPGTDIISCKSRVSGASTLWGSVSGEAGEYYRFCGGTSMAAPLVSGLAALARQYFGEYHSVTNPSAALLKAAIINGAVSLYPGQYGTNDYLEVPNTTGNNVEGWGQVNAGNTFFPDGKENIFWDRNRLQTAEEHVFELNVTDTNGISATLVWTDPPASLISSVQLVNDLDLMLISPSGVTNRPNGLTVADHTNNVEQVDLAVCETGLWTMVVSGTSVPEGPQPYALFSSFSGDADNAFEVTSVWHEPDTVVGTDDPVELFASLTTGGKELAASAMVWREDGGDWIYEPLTLIGTNGENLVYSAPIEVSGVGVIVDYYAYAFSYDMELVKSFTNQFRVNSPVIYVSPNGMQTCPYNSLQNAYTNLQQALDDATPGLEIRVDDGFYETELIVLEDDITLTSVNGPESTVLDFYAQNYPAMVIYDATVSGFTVQGGFSAYDTAAGGVTISGGVLSNCWVRDNFSYVYAGGVYLYDGLVTHCRIEDNLCYYYYGGGLLTQGGLVENCIVTGNQSGSDAGGVEVWGGTIRNCTFVDNYAGGCGGGVDIGDAALIENCIVVSNTAALGGDNWYEWVPMDMRYSCTAPRPSGAGNMDADPLFADAAGGDYHLQSTYGRFTTNGWTMDALDSPCIDFGSPLSDASQEPTASRVNIGAYGNTSEASLSGTNETRLLVQAVDGATDPTAGVHIYSPEDLVSVSLTDDPFTVGTTQYQFSAWSMDNSWGRSSSTAASLDLPMTNNWIVEASHDVFYRMDLYPGTNGAVNFSNGWYAADSILSAAAVPDLYYGFDGWTGDASLTNNPLNVSLTQPLEMMAQFSLAYTANGVPQWWLGEYGWTNDFEAASVDDPDGDGAQTWQEYVAGTLPLNSNSVLKLELDMQPGTNSLSWMAQADRTYTLYYGTNLVDGITNVLVEYYSIFPMSLWLPDYLHADQPSVFYRLEVECDGD